MDKVLFVDDDPNILEAYQRLLRKRCAMDKALNGAEGIEKIVEKGPYAIVVSDYRMPGMDGIEFLSRVREIAPDSVRILLTGHADLDMAINAVNEINLFRLLTKPCAPEVLDKALVAGIRQYQLVTAEKDILEKTLNGCIKVMTDLISLLNPEAFSRASRITRYAEQISHIVDDPHPWKTETAARLSQIGFIIVPDHLLMKVKMGWALTDNEKELWNKHPAIASKLIKNIPRMEEVAEIVAYQQKHYNGEGIPEDSVQGENIPLGARILKVIIDFDSLVSGGKSKGEAYEEIKRQARKYDPKVVKALEVVLGDEARYALRQVSVYALQEGMILAEDIFTVEKPRLLLARGQELSETSIEYLKRYRRAFGVKEPITVATPLKKI
jgi:response regulator RpfG family c-di-GMP phosphodiesterase